MQRPASFKEPPIFLCDDFRKAASQGFLTPFLRI
jgi:hypothetical protein